MKKNSQMAQMTHLASFGPVFFSLLPSIALHVTYFVHYKLYIPYNISQYQKKIEGKDLLMAKRHIWRCLGAFFSLLRSIALPVAYFIDYKLYIQYNISQYQKKVEGKHLLIAQTTQDASFGPVFVVITFHLPSCSVFGSLQPIDTVKNQLVTKKYEIYKKDTY